MIKIKRLHKFSLAVLILMLPVFVVVAQNDITTEIRYYGTGCLTIQRGDDALLTDPYVSNLSSTKVALGKVKTDVDYVN